MSVDAPRRIAVFSDIHGNLDAFHAVLASIDALNVDWMICLGDVVGYGAFPNECIHLLREREIVTLAGNHDHGAIGLTDIQYFNEIARRAMHWTREQLTDENAQWLRERPYTWELGSTYYFVHASPYRPEQWGYVLGFGDARIAFQHFSHRLGFIGHSHVPRVLRLAGQDPELIEDIYPGTIDLDSTQRFLINVGSVGQPRDRDPDACFITIDLDQDTLQYHRIEYDVSAAQRSILENELPEELAIRLGYGY